MTSILLITFTCFLLAGSWAWGSLLQEFISRRFSLNLRAGLIPIVQIPLGIACFLFVSGWLVAFNLAWVWLLLLWHVLGILLRSKKLLRHLVAYKIEKMTISKGNVLFDSLAFVVISMVGVGITATRMFNNYDDWPSYMYFARKIIATGGMLDPFNNRRVTSYGGGSVYQAIFVKLFGNQGVFAFDNFFAAVALIILVTCILRNFNVHRLTVWLFALATLVGTGAGFEFNLSPRYSLTLLTIAVLVIIWESLKSEFTYDYAFYIGLLVAGIFTLRFQNVVLPIVALLTVLLLPKMRMIKPLVLVFVTMALSLIGWAFALQRSSKTLLYPLFHGTAVPGWGVQPDSFSPSKYLSILWQTVRFNNEFLILLLGLLGATYVLRFAKQKSESVPVLLVAVFGALVQLVISVALFKGFDPWTISRYMGPTIFAVGIFAVIVLLVLDAQKNESVIGRDVLGSAKAFFKSPLIVIDRRGYLVAAVIFSFAVCMGYQAPLNAKSVTNPLLSTEFKTTLQNFKWDFTNGLNGLKGYNFFTNGLASYDPTFSAINDSIPKNASVLSAIETPSLLDMSKFTVSTIDWPGANSPAPGIPLSAGGPAVMGYLDRLGYGYVVVESPASSFNVYSSGDIKWGLSTNVYNYRFNSLALKSWVDGIGTVLSSNHYCVDFYNSFAVIHTGYLKDAGNTTATFSADLKKYLNNG